MSREIRAELFDRIPADALDLRTSRFPASDGSLVGSDEFDERSLHVVFREAAQFAAYVRLTIGAPGVFRTWSQGAAAIPEGPEVADLGRCCVHPAYKRLELLRSACVEALVYSFKRNLTHVNGTHVPVTKLALSCALLLSLSASGQPGDSAFLLPSGKALSIKVQELPGEPSRLVFDVGEHKQIIPIGPPHTIRDRPEESDGFPLRSRAISLPSMKEPLVLAYSSEAGASDCSYSVTSIGIVDGEMPRFVSSNEVTFSNEGGLAVWASGRRTNMVVWNPIWVGREGHYGAHRYVYYWYSWNPSRHKFQYTRSTESSKRLDSGDDSLDLAARSTIEISARTRADWFPEAADGC
jgi:hypothetical protein